MGSADPAVIRRLPAGTAQLRGPAVQIPPPPTPADDPRQPGACPPPGRHPYGSVRLAAPVAAAEPPAPRAAATGHWPDGRVAVPLLSVGALRAARRRDR
ncbi:hypothetical protein [Streptomyces sp. NPDC049040]|uniref:hypothetical protein n=1 Tax=Streptomyces sp. NPDC049040 TaxID=3365593 RepID=UPI00371E90F1